MASTYLQRTTSSLGSATTSTLSVWVKRNKLSAEQKILFWGTGSTNFNVEFKSDDKLVTNSYNGSGQDMLYKTTRVFRDTSAWYHIVLKIDTTQATASDRIKLYVNGVQETVFDSSTVPSQNETLEINYFNNSQPYIGQNGSGSHFFDGSMSHFHWIDGTAYDASAFGETDANGVWTIKTGANVTYGTNGFFILKDSGSVTDQSGNGNNFTVSGGTLTDTLDCPDNVFAIWNALDNANASTMSNGNTKITTVTSNYSPNTSTLRTIDGKWYWEVKLAQHTNSGENEADMVGIGNNSVQSATTNPSSIGINYRGNGRVWNYGGTSETPVGDYPTYSSGDIIMVAMDLSDSTTGKLYFGKNGTWGNSGNPVTGANSYDFTKGTEAWGAMVTTYSSGSSGIWEANFGNGYFGTTAVASAGTNASGNGIFEYDVPTGYTALCTKGLNGE